MWHPTTIVKHHSSCHLKRLKLSNIIFTFVCIHIHIFVQKHFSKFELITSWNNANTSTIKSHKFFQLTQWAIFEFNMFNEILANPNFDIHFF